MSKAFRLVAFALSIPLAACAVAPSGAGSNEPSSSDEQTTPQTAAIESSPIVEKKAVELARVVTHTGTTVAFFEAKPGQVLVLEQGEVGATAALDARNQRLPLSALYHAIGGSRAVPEALLLAEHREADVRSRLPLEALSAHATRTEATASLAQSSTAKPIVIPNTTIATGSCAASKFVANGGCMGGGNKNWCLLDWWNGAYEAASHTDISDAWACADIGSFLFHAQSDDGTVVDWSVLQGRWVHFAFHDNAWPSLPSLRYDIKNASGSRFQFGGSFYWY